MEVKIRIVPEREAPALVLETPALTPQVERLAQRLSALDDGTLPGFQADKAFLLETARLTCLYAQDKGVYGTIKISLVDGAACYASRRYVKKIKQALGL